LNDQLQTIRKGMEEVKDQKKGLSMRIASPIIMKGLTTNYASFFEALCDVYPMYVCEFRSAILCMRLIEFLADVG
jgi:hypothetical protein